MYRRNTPRRSRGRTAFSTGFVVLIIFLVFAASVYWFRQKGEDPLTSISPSTVSLSIGNPNIVGIDFKNTEAVLRDVGGESATGHATRGTQEGYFYHTVKTSLPAIDREKQFYEGWLLRPVPFDFFSTGEMVTNDLGEFVLVWAGEPGKDYQAYTKVVITIENKDGNPDPAQHILEGEFGN